ncbi:hypothetical protein D3C75_657010 [compost metagenome]
MTEYRVVLITKPGVLGDYPYRANFQNGLALFDIGSLQPDIVALSHLEERFKRLSLLILGRDGINLLIELLRA